MVSRLGQVEVCGVPSQPPIPTHPQARSSSAARVTSAASSKATGAGASQGAGRCLQRCCLPLGLLQLLVECPGLRILNAAPLRYGPVAEGRHERPHGRRHGRRLPHASAIIRSLLPTSGWLATPCQCTMTVSRRHRNNAGYHAREGIKHMQHSWSRHASGCRDEGLAICTSVPAAAVAATALCWHVTSTPALPARPVAWLLAAAVCLP
jgi:hypothetical protein